MTLEEIWSNIEQSTGVKKRIGDASLPNNYMFMIIDKNDAIYPVYQAMSNKSYSTWTKTTLRNGIKNLFKDDDPRLIFNPYALNTGLTRWIFAKPENVITKQLLFSTFGIRNFKIKGFKDFYKQVTLDLPKFIAETVCKSDGRVLNSRGQARIINSIPLRLRPPIRNEDYFDINIEMTEWGNCSYSCTNIYSSINLQGLIPEFRAASDAGESRDELTARIRHYIMDNVSDGDFDSEDYDHENYSGEDSELKDDYTDYNEILATILSNEN